MLLLEEFSSEDWLLKSDVFDWKENLPKLLLSIEELQCGDGSGLLANDCVELVPFTALVLCDHVYNRKHAKKPEVFFPLHVIGWTLLGLGLLFRNRKSISRLGGTTMMLETKLTQIWWSPNVKGPRTTALFSWTRSLDLKHEIYGDMWSSFDQFFMFIDEWSIKKSFLRAILGRPIKYDIGYNFKMYHAITFNTGIYFTYVKRGRALWFLIYSFICFFTPNLYLQFFKL